MNRMFRRSAVGLASVTVTMGLVLGCLTGCNSCGGSRLAPNKTHRASWSQENTTGPVAKNESSSAISKLRDWLSKRSLDGTGLPEGVSISNSPISVKGWPRADGMLLSSDGVRMVLPPSTRTIALDTTQSLCSKEAARTCIIAYSRDDVKTPLFIRYGGYVGDIMQCIYTATDGVVKTILSHIEKQELTEAVQRLLESSDEELFVLAMSLDVKALLRANDARPEMLLLASVSADLQPVYAETGWRTLKTSKLHVYVAQQDGKLGHDIVVFDRSGVLLVSFAANSQSLDLRDALRTAVTVERWPSAQDKRAK